MSLATKTGRELLVDLINAGMPEARRLPGNEWSISVPTRYADPAHPGYNAQVTIAPVSNRNVRLKRYFKRLDLTQLAYGKNVSFTVENGDSVEDIVATLNTRLGIKADKYDYKELAFHVSGPHTLEAHPDSYLVAGAVILDITVPVPAPAPAPAPPPAPNTDLQDAIAAFLAEPSEITYLAYYEALGTEGPAYSEEAELALFEELSA